MCLTVGSCILATVAARARGIPRRQGAAALYRDGRGVEACSYPAFADGGDVSVENNVGGECDEHSYVLRLCIEHIPHVI